MIVRNLTKITFNFVEFYHISKTLEQVPVLGDALLAMLKGTQAILLELAATTADSAIEKAELDVTFPLDVLEELAKIFALRLPSQDRAIGLETEVTDPLAERLVGAVVQARRAQAEVSDGELIDIAREWKPSLFGKPPVETSGIGPDDEIDCNCPLCTNF